MYLHSRKYLLDLSFKFFCFFQISCISSLKTHLTVRYVFLKTCFPIILHCLQHGTFGLLLATDLGVGIQLLSLDLKYRLQVQNRSDGCCCRCDPATFFQIFQGVKCDINTGIEFLICKDLLDLCSTFSCLGKHLSIHYRLSLCYGNPLIVHYLNTTIIINSKSHCSRTGCTQSA